MQLRHESLYTGMIWHKRIIKDPSESLMVKLSQVLAFMTQGAVWDLVYFAILLQVVRGIQYSGEKNNYLGQKEIDEALESTSKALVGTVLEGIIISIDEAGNWWENFVDSIVDKLSLVEDSRLRKYKLELHKLIADSKVIDLSMYGTPLVFVKKLLKRV